jgi:hypothetical protein
MELGRKFTAYGQYTLGAHLRGVEYIKSRLYKEGDGSQNASSVTYTTQDPYTWMADYDVPADVWPDGETGLILEVTMKLVGSDNIYASSVDTLTLIGATATGRVGITHPPSNSTISANPPTDGTVYDSSTVWVTSQYLRNGAGISNPVTANWPYFGRVWSTSQTITANDGDDKISMIVTAGDLFSTWGCTVSSINLTYKSS